MTHDQHAMAEMAGGIEESQGDAFRAAAAHGVDAGAVVAAELAAESSWAPAPDHAVADAVPAGLAALEAETED
jgi:hypothetical protein